MQSYFLLPSGAEAVSGGNLYNAALARALAAPTLAFAAGAEQIRSGAPGLYLIDTLDLRASLSLERGPEQYFVLLVHHLPSLEPGLDPADEALAVEAAALPRFDALVATSPFTAEWLVGRGVPRERIMTVMPGLRAVKIAPRVYTPPLRALLVGNLIPRKSVRELMRALATRPGELVLDVVGRADLDLAYAAECAALAAQDRRVRLVGPVPHAGMGAIYATHHLLVSAATMETYGMALAEARAHGLPILALDRGWQRYQFRDGETGRSFDSVDALADALVELARDARAMAPLYASAQAAGGSGDTWPIAAAHFRAGILRVLG